MKRYMCPARLVVAPAAYRLMRRQKLDVSAPVQNQAEAV